MRTSILFAVLVPLLAAAHPGHGSDIAAADVMHLLLEHALPLGALAVAMVFAWRRGRRRRTR
jgi:hypothetical protein